jgi:hypothetical protein
MNAFEEDDKEIVIQIDSYELRASQEEFYLEETEEELRMILACDLTSPRSPETSLSDAEKESEELFTGDADDPPLSEEQLEALRRY